MAPSAPHLLRTLRRPVLRTCSSLGGGDVGQVVGYAARVQRLGEVEYEVPMLGWHLIRFASVQEEELEPRETLVLLERVEDRRFRVPAILGEEP